MKVSLVMSTLGRFDEVLQFIETLRRSTHQNLELIIVDQNTDDRLQLACAALATPFPLVHLKAAGERGLSRGRNVGIARSTGDLICFPDDDCTYPPALLADVIALLSSTGSDVICGRAAAADGRSINGRFEAVAQEVNRANVFTTQIEWVVFFRRRVLDIIGGFDEAIGVGAATPWQACEGPDITLRAIDAGFAVHYDPRIYAHHPELDTRHPGRVMRRKGRAYARGMGWVIKKHGYPPQFLFWYLVRPAGGACLSLARLQFRRLLYYVNVGVGRLEGYTKRCIGRS